jgi:polysaccharide pyruvyl transferase CsaB
MATIHSSTLETWIIQVGIDSAFIGLYKEQTKYFYSGIIIMQRRVVLCGYYGMGNGGDEALLATLLQMLPPDVEPVVLSKTPVETARTYGVRSIDRWQLGEILRVFRRGDWFVWGVGSLIQDSSSRVSPLYYLGIMGLAQLWGMGTIAWGQGIGPLEGRLNRGLTKFLLGRCRGVSVRDRGSSELLTRWGIKHLLAPDPVWAMETGAGPRVENRPPVVAVNLREHRTMTTDRFEKFVAALVAFQKSTGAVVWLVPFQASLDLGLAEQLRARVPGSVVKLEGDPEALRRLFDLVDMAIVMRLHGLIMAAAAGVKCFALCYDPKVSRVAEALHLSKWELREGNDVDLEKLWGDVLTGEALDEGVRSGLCTGAKAHQTMLREIIN